MQGSVPESVQRCTSAMVIDDLHMRIPRALRLLLGTAAALPAYPLLPAVPELDGHDRLSREKYAALPQHSPIRLRIRQFAEDFHTSLEPHRHEVSLKSDAHHLQPETILSAMFVEYARMQSFTFAEALRTREGLRTGIKYGLLGLPGGEYVVETLLGKSVGYGNVHRATLEQALAHPYSPSTSMANGTHREPTAAINSLCQVLALHQQIWERAGFPLYTYPFPAVRAQSDRVGLHITLYNIFDFAKRASAPHGDPKIGGSVIPALQMRFGDLAAIYAEQHASTFTL